MKCVEKDCGMVCGAWRLEQEIGRGAYGVVYLAAGDPVHEVEVIPDTLLSSIVGAGPLRVNSRHHQGIKALGKNLRINAKAPDGLIEGIELPDHPFVLGVQWHPESLSDRYPEHQRLFDAFIHSCADHCHPV